MATVDHRATVALRKLGNVPEGFEFYEWKCMNDPDGTVMLTGAPVKGKRNGRKVYGPKRHALVTDAEMLAERRRFEQEEGKCAECGGDGQMFKGWHYIEGTTWRPCVKCQATGKPLSADAVDPSAASTGKPSTRA